MMYKVNDTILYGNEGVCKIIEITSRTFKNQVMDYYVLKPVYSENATVYVPVHNQELLNKMKKILSAQEIIDLIHKMPESESVWIQNDNQRKEKYREILRSGDREELMKIVRTLYLHQQKLKESGKKFHATDDKILKEAEKILYDEFAYVLNIHQDEVVPFICQEIEVKERDKKS